MHGCLRDDYSGFGELQIPVPDPPVLRGLALHSQASALLPSGLGASPGL